MSNFGRGPGPQQDVNIDTDRSIEFDYLADFAATTREIQSQIMEIHHRAADGCVPQAYGGQGTLICARLFGVSHVFCLISVNQSKLRTLSRIWRSNAPLV